MLKLLMILLVIFLVLGLYYFFFHREGFINNQETVFTDNKFKQITLPELENYDIEIAIPSGQILFNTIQGNWGISTDENNNGTTFGVYRDGYTSDGSIFKGRSGKRYKRLLEQGPYVLKYENRKNNKGGYDVNIFVDNKFIETAHNEGTPAKNLKVIGSNYDIYNNLTINKQRGRRPVDYIKFIPKEVKETFKNINNCNFSFHQKMRLRSAPNKTKKNELLAQYCPSEFGENAGVAKQDNNPESQGIQKERQRQLTEAEARERDNRIERQREEAKRQQQLQAELQRDARLEEERRVARLERQRRQREIEEQRLREQRARQLRIQKEQEEKEKQEQLRQRQREIIRKRQQQAIEAEKLRKQQAEEQLRKKAQEERNKNVNQKINDKIQNDPEPVQSSQCPKNCSAPTSINNSCDTNIFTNVIDGKSSYYRKCNWSCLREGDDDYVDYDKSGMDNNGNYVPYDINRDGCRINEQCKNCGVSNIKTDKYGKDWRKMMKEKVNEMINKFPAESSMLNEEEESIEENKVDLTYVNKMLKDGADNRLGGESVIYRPSYSKGYKPQNPNEGVRYYDSIWKFD